MNNFRKAHTFLRNIPSRSALETKLSTSACYKKEVVEFTIPKRIPRSSTDILRALANTVQQDVTAPHYKYHDDPYFIPMSNVGKRTFALAKESGRKAAKWVRAQHPEFFQHLVADPPIKDYFPLEVYTEESKVDTDTLKTLIEDCRVSDAITVYQILENAGKDVPASIKQAFLELICFFNCEEAHAEDLIEEHWFRQGPRGYARLRKTWKDNGLAEKIFTSLKSPDASAYCALIQGMTRFYQVERAWQLYQEMLQKGMPLTVEAYNSLIRVSNFLRESNELRWKLIEELLTAMSKQELVPNVGTLNAVLEVISSMSSQKLSKTYALQILSEFRRINIEPSLGSYYYLLMIFCKERGPVSSILLDIMNYIENKEYKVTHPKDTFFFVTAMDVCRNHLQDKELAYRLDKFLHRGNNYDLIGDSYKESIYYRHFFALLCVSEPLDVLMEYYNKLIPHIYIPEPSVMEEVIKAIDLSGQVDHLPRVWSDMVTFDHTDREKLISNLLESMARNLPPVDSPTALQFADVAWEIFNKFQEKVDVKSALSWTGQNLGSIIILLLNGQEIEKAFAVLDKLDKEHHNKIVGLPEVTVLNQLLDACIAVNNSEKAVVCIRYCADAGYSEAENMGAKLKEKLQLDSTTLERLATVLNRGMAKILPNLSENKS
ncbi:LOW QUALITY PROTEIN: protein PTCD3 homolog, mitochondrial [Schistocerca piceifrons]|uniref:LOW QUALITY PROTEIN: protein PTCD3 homolog, mitochondrial n=1 Tax=Schistocerca piceifrons TaxID=274613 RepID=UPI001F5F770F|nr:LOW QUALITY PROTEIN: protein PTCD3 homolog, mitochondrial [Schistocerca piceifrons]